MFRVVLLAPARRVVVARPALAAPLLLRAALAVARVPLAAPRVGVFVARAVGAERVLAGFFVAVGFAAPLRTFPGAARPVDFAPRFAPARLAAAERAVLGLAAFFGLDAFLGLTALAAGFFAALVLAGAFAERFAPALLAVAFAPLRFCFSVSAELDLPLLPAFLIVFAVAIVLSFALQQVHRPAGRLVQ